MSSESENTYQQANNSTYTISARGKFAHEPVKRFLQDNYSQVPLNKIESLFGFVEPSTLYGGRNFTAPQLSNEDVVTLNDMNIGLRIPFTNHFADRNEYKATLPLLKKYHNSINSVICTNDDLAAWIKEDFPLYDIEASVIKNLVDLTQINDALTLYHTVVLPMSANDDDELLDSIKDKARIRLFANGGCAYTCPAKLCYKSFSKMNKFTGASFKCSYQLKERKFEGIVDFDLTSLQEKGFHKFKLLREKVGANSRY